MTLEADILFSIVANETDAGDYAKDVRTTKVENFIALTDGTGANQAQIAWSDSRTATNSGDAIDLRALVDDRGTITFTAIKAMYFRNTGAAMIYWGDVNQPWSAFVEDLGDSNLLFPAGTAMLLTASSAAGFEVSPQSKNINLVAFQGSSTYEIVLIGEGTIT